MARKNKKVKGTRAHQAEKSYKKKGKNFPLGGAHASSAEGRYDKQEMQDRVMGPNVEEFNMRYDRTVEMATATDADPTPERYAELLGHYEEFAEWIDSNTHVKEYGRYALRINELNKILLRRVDNRLRALSKIPAGQRSSEELTELEGWRAIWERMNPEEAKEINEEIAARHARETAEEPPPPVTKHYRHSHWEEVVDLQDELIRFWYTPFGNAYGRAFGEHMVEAGAANPEFKEDRSGNGPVWSPQDMDWAKNLDLIERAKLQLANPIYINNEVQDLIEQAARHPTFEMQSLRREDVFPNMYGFAVFPRPFVVIDSHGKELSFRAISWTPTDLQGRIAFEAGAMPMLRPDQCKGLLVTGYTHRDDPDDYPLKVQVGPKEEARFNKNDLPIMSLCYVTPWKFDTEQAPIDMTGSGLNEFCAITQTMWRFARQKITAPERTALPRPARRRAERSGLVSDVVVLRLRQIKRESKSDAPQAVEWSHRWIVGGGTGGFWRNQWYPKAGIHQQIWIDPYVKGPPNKPLLIKPLRAYELTR